MAVKRPAALLLALSVACGAGTETSTTTTAPPTTPSPPREPVPQAELPPPCVVFENARTRGAAREGLAERTNMAEVAIGSGAWQRGSAPPLLRREEAIAAGGAVDEPWVRVSAREGGPDVSYAWDREGRLMRARVLTDDWSYEYVYAYDCRGIAVRYPRPLVSPCRAIVENGTVAVLCWYVAEPQTIECSEELGRGDFTDAEAEEVVIGCRGTCDDAEDPAMFRRAFPVPSVKVAVVLSGDTPVLAVHAGDDGACMEAEVLRFVEARPRLKLTGWGDERFYAAEYEWRDGRMELYDIRFQSPDWD
jgi:hypothetical protein